MPVTLIDTPNAIDANSFCDVDYADAYWLTRAPSELWDNVDDKAAALINATRMIVNAVRPHREYFPATAQRIAYFYVHPTWTGAPATTTQVLPWGRIGMYDNNGNAIASTTIPNELKDATSEVAGQLSTDGTADRMIDLSQALKGIKELKAGPVNIVYRDGTPLVRALPSILWHFLLPSWLTDAIEEPTKSSVFEVVSN